MPKNIGPLLDPNKGDRVAFIEENWEKSPYKAKLDCFYERQEALSQDSLLPSCLKRLFPSTASFAKENSDGYWTLESTHKNLTQSTSLKTLK